MRTLFELTEKTAVVTGASSGLGRAIAHGLAGAGARVVLVARRRAALEEAAREIREADGKAEVISADLGDYAGASALAEQVQGQFGTADILVNAAGINLREPVGQVTAESWEQTLRINLGVPFFLARALVQPMRERGWGRVINVASLQSLRAFPDSLPYGASKGGVCQLTRAMAEAWSADGVNCNAIAPGFFPTELTASVFADAERAESLARQTAIGRNGRLEDVWGAAIFLASRASDYITGQTLFVDGGFTAT